MALTEIDRNLLNRCLANEPGAWKDFVDRFIGLFVHVVQHTAHARSVRLSQADADDLCADVFVALLNNDFAVLRQFRGQSSLATYLTVVARRVVVHEMMRKRAGEGPGQVPLEQESAAPDAARHEQQRIEDREEVARLLEQISGPDADIIRKFHLEGKTYRQISIDMGIPENTIGPTLSRARDRLRRRQLQS